MEIGGKREPDVNCSDLFLLQTNIYHLNYRRGKENEFRPNLTLYKLQNLFVDVKGEMIHRYIRGFLNIRENLFF